MGKKHALEPKTGWLPLILLATISIGLLSPWGQTLEEGFGLNTLFQLRGERQPPAGVAVVAITEKTASALNLPGRITDWPRTVYADLVRELQRLGAAMIIFDVYFREPGDPEADQQFANAIKQHGNVILFAYSHRQITTIGDHRIIQDSISEPIPLLANAARQTAPFLLPKVSSQASRYWLQWEVNPPRWTLPAAAFQRFPSAAKDQDYLAKLAPAQIYNFYGPPYTVPTLALEDVLLTPRPDTRGFNNAVIFVGYSARYQPDQKDGFYTPFTSSGSLDISGVELAATAYGNLLERSNISYSLPVWLLAFLIYGLLSFLISTPLSMGPRLSFQPRPSLGHNLAAIVVLALVYMVISYISFSQFYFWLPWVTPVLILTPMAAVYCAWQQIRAVKLQKVRLENAFGQYLPTTEIRRLAQHPEQLPQQEKLFGVCMVTDAEGYTTIAESLTTEQLGEVLKRYYAAVITPIREHGGIISDVAGDGVIALWPHIPEESVWATMTPALKALQDSIGRFNRQNPDTPLPTRVGVHAGEVVLGHFGASDHFEFRAIGDIVNTTSRIENANKILGMKLLLSSACIQGHTGQLRCLGNYSLSGKMQPVTLYSPITPPWSRKLETRFQHALIQLRQGQVAEALRTLKQLHQETSDPV